MSQPLRILYCHCAYAKVVPEEVKEEVLAGLSASGVAFEAVPDLCELAARRDPRMRQLADQADGDLEIAACYPRAVKGLFIAADAPLPDDGVDVLNMRTQPAEQILASLLSDRADPEPQAADPPDTAPPRAVDRELAEQLAPQPGGWKPWFPVIDYDRCTHCMQCLSFCLFDVYGATPDGRITVKTASNCKTDCPACSRVCPEAAIMFPKYASGPINGDEVTEKDLGREKMKVDISALLGGDIYGALRQRGQDAEQRFAKERDDRKALQERRRCLTKLTKDLDIPPEVLAALPSVDDIQEKADRAVRAAREARQSDGEIERPRDSGRENGQARAMDDHQL